MIARARAFLPHTPGKRVSFKSDHHDLHIPSVEFFFVIAQMREMGSAGQSTKVSMKNHQKPIPLVVVERYCPPFTVATVERNSRLSCKVLHGASFLIRINRQE